MGAHWHVSTPVAYKVGTEKVDLAAQTLGMMLALELGDRGSLIRWQQSVSVSYWLPWNADGTHRS